ncbi:MAG: CcoQ/FixQ family Cbb3-type cytochrome c oxidase assembly chaperone [Ferruginibacter sp.]|nr:CcoQ/FixQ family Cbb3-type cytochrome c oxidase assembly chaperone [Chitinophagaceae bacterium]MBP6285590.1 CcoQ/FixQ family Cbb3-type cytochrome c oxidase assembly chaperone [Ferruginibacter sp.]MBU9935567.1 CcoQ/FixQ family Cbb3-type cytochrome c oxidase assembly chaperone [Ferruginibacter sp.]
MFKFIKQYAETINNVDIYPIISLFIFFTFFVVLLVLVKRMKKERVETLANIPFDNEETTNSIS